MKKDELFRLGFKEEFVSQEESGDAPYYYYTLEIRDYCVLITNASDECLNDEYIVEFFDLLDSNLKIQDSDVPALVGILNRMQ